MACRRSCALITFCTGDPKEDAKTKSMIQRLASAIPEGPKIFDESVMFQDQPSASGLTLKEDFRNRFRNVSRVMDCVGCDKCRLWGKVQTNGFGTALKVLFEFGNGGGKDETHLLRRTELVALINTLDKISVALKALETFRDLMIEQGQVEGHGKRPSSAAKAPERPVPSAVKDTRFEQLDELDDFEDFDNTDDHPRAEPTISELFWNELNAVYEAFIWVITSWIQAPGIAWEIGKYEALRFWYYWLGYDVPARKWTYNLPPKPDFMRDEL